MLYCEKCKRKLGFLEKFCDPGYNINTVYPEFRNKRLCDTCRAELNDIAIEELRKREKASLERQNEIVRELPSPLPQTLPALTRIVAYVIYRCENRKSTWPQISKIMPSANVTALSLALRELAKQGYASASAPGGVYTCKLTLKGEKWIEEKGLPKINDGSIGIELSGDIKKTILWQNEEVALDYINCKEFFEDRSVSFGARVGRNGCLVLTNQRIIFACKIGMLSKDYAVTYLANLEDVSSVSHGRFGFNDKLIILDKNSQHKDFVQPCIQRLIPTINSTITKRKNEIESEEKKKRIHIVLDFSSLRNVLSKGGIVMTNYKCPNCNGMVDLPDTGKVLICKYCGNQIKPVDIFEKIKSLL
jgi:hypothetical protein